MKIEIQEMYNSGLNKTGHTLNSLNCNSHKETFGSQLDHINTLLFPQLLYSNAENENIQILQNAVAHLPLNYYITCNLQVLIFHVSIIYEPFS